VVSETHSKAMGVLAPQIEPHIPRFQIASMKIMSNIHVLFVF
jgi:hypothetical protein